MKMKYFLATLMAFYLMNANANPNDTLSVNTQIGEEQLVELYQVYIDSIVQAMNYETGVVTLEDGIAQIHVPQGFKYLNPEQSEYVLTDLWGNPPGDDKSLGMLFLEGDTPLTDSSYVINITYVDDGYVKDSDAKDIDYDELEQTMKQDAASVNAEREAAGYPTIEFIGWATPPHYSSEEKKLYWAQELMFGDSPDHTLNYNIRILGRRGYLELNAIGQMNVLDEVTNNIDPIIESVNFNKGYRYADFNANLDKVAAYGIGGLIAGKVLLKAGILAKLGILLAKFWKVIVLAVVGVATGIRKMFKRES